MDDRRKRDSAELPADGPTFFPAFPYLSVFLLYSQKGTSGTVVYVYNMPKILHIVLCKANPEAGDFTKEWIQKGEAMLGER